MALSAVPSVASVSPPCCWKATVVQRGKQQFVSSSPSRLNLGVRACCSLLNPDQHPILKEALKQPILKEALKEPVAFVGGIFAGLLRLDLNEDPLKEWVTLTVAAAGISEEEIHGSDVQEEETPQQIVIE